MKTIVVFGAVLCLLYPTFAPAVGGGNISFTPKNASPVIFSHDFHVTEKGLRCSGCHYAIFQMAQGSYKMDRAKITKRGFCNNCHNGEKSFDIDDAKNCVRCHK